MVGTTPGMAGTTPSTRYPYPQQAPTMSGCPSGITVNTAAGTDTQVATWTPPTASDNLAVSSVTSTHSPGDTFTFGTTMVWLSLGVLQRPPGTTPSTMGTTTRGSPQGTRDGPQGTRGWSPGY